MDQHKYDNVLDSNTIFLKLWNMHLKHPKVITFLFKNSSGYYFTNQSGYLVQMVKRAKDTKYHIFPSDVQSYLNFIKKN